MASKAIGFLNFKFGADLGGFERAMNKAQKKLKKFGKSVERTGKNMTMGLTLPIVALGGTAIKTFADFEQAMLKVKAVSGATGKDFEKLTESAKKLGASTMFSASQVAELQLELSKLGFSSDEILNSTDAVLKLAQATDTELAAAAETTAVAINAFGLEASDAAMIADVFAQASSSAAVDMEKLAAVLPNAASTARAFGDDVVQMTAKIQTLADVTGMEGGKLGTHMKLIYKGLATNGLTYEEAMEKIRNSTDKIAVATKLFGGNAFGSAIALSEVTEKTKQYEIELRKSGGAAQRMADIMDSGVAGAMRKLKSQTEGLLIQLGTALMPVFQKMMGALSSLVEWFSGLSKEQKDNVVKWGLILAAIGPVLIVIGKMSTGIGALIGMFKGLKKWIVANPYIALAAGIGLVVAQVTKLILEYDGLTTTQRALNSINETAQTQTIAQQVEVGRLTDILKDENSTLEDKELALKSLNEIAPEYYGQLNAAALDVIALDKATGDYIDTLLTQAKVQAAQETLVDLMKEQIDLQKQYKELTGTKADVKSIFSAIMPGVGLQQSADLITVLERSKTISKDIIAVTSMINTGKKELDKTSKESIATTEEEINISNDLLILIEKLEGAQKKLNKPNTEGTEKKVEQMEALSLATNDTFEEIHLLSDRLDGLKMPEGLFNTDPMDKYRGALGMLGDQIATFVGEDIESLEEGLASITERMGDELAQGADTFQEYADNVKGMIKEIIGALISQGVAAAVSKALMSAGLINPFLIPVIAGLAAGLARTAFNSLIPAFAEGGLVTGPTTALIGEGVGTTASNPEVVAPLDKLKQYMGGGSQNIIVEGVLKGNDIYLSNRNTSVNRLRTT